MNSPGGVLFRTLSTYDASTTGLLVQVLQDGRADEEEEGETGDSSHRG